MLEPTQLSINQKLRRFFNRLLLFLIFVLPLLFALYTWGTLTYVYAKGERAGYLQKISKKGFVFKTWEGEMAMVNLPGAMPEIFHFSIRKDDVAKRVAENLGKRVTLYYNQHIGIPVNWFGETSYFVSDIRPISEATPIK